MYSCMNKHMLTGSQVRPTTNFGDFTQTQPVDSDSTQHAERPARFPPESSSPLLSPEPTASLVPTRSRISQLSSSSLPPSDPSAFSVPSNASFREDETVDTQMLSKELLGRGFEEDSEMLGE